HSAIELFNRATEKQEVQRCRAPDGGAVKHRVVGNNVVSNARMDGERDVEPKGLADDRGILPGMLDRNAPGGNSMGEHGLEQLGARRREGMARFITQSVCQRFSGRKLNPVLRYEASEAPAIALISQSAGKQGHVDAASGFF